MGEDVSPRGKYSSKLAPAIHLANESDFVGILDCLGAAFGPFRSQYTDQGFLDTVLTPERLRQRWNEMSIFVATTSPGKVVGTVACKMLNCHEGHIRGMAVHAEWHGTGLSTALLQRAEDELRSRGCRTVTLDTTEPLKRAVHFYEKNGYRASGKVGCFFGMRLFEYSKSL